MMKLLFTEIVNNMNIESSFHKNFNLSFTMYVHCHMSHSTGSPEGEGGHCLAFLGENLYWPKGS